MLKMMEKVFDVPVYKGTISSLNTAGMTAVVTNKGLLCHPKVTEGEKRVLEGLKCGCVRFYGMFLFVRGENYYTMQTVPKILYLSKR